MAVTIEPCHGKPVFDVSDQAIKTRPYPDFSHMMELNRSDRSEIYQDQELLEAVLQAKDDPPRLNDSGGSRLSTLGSTLLARQNGNLSRPSSFVSKRSITLSQEKLSDPGGTVFDITECTNSQLIDSNLKFLALLCISSLVLCSLSLQMLVSLSSGQTSMTLADTLTETNSSYDEVLDAATAMAIFVITLDVTCLLVCSLQCFVVVKLLKVHLGEERALKYLKDCSSSRFIAVSGFFMSLPGFLISMILFIVLRFKVTAAITGCVIISAGIIFCVLSVMQNSYHWRIENSRAADGLPVYELPPVKQDCVKEPAGRELSTLV